VCTVLGKCCGVPLTVSVYVLRGVRSMDLAGIGGWKPGEAGVRSAFWGKTFGDVEWNPYQFRRFIGRQLMHRLASWTDKPPD